MSKITNDGLTRSGTGCFIPVPATHMTTVVVKGLINCALKLLDGHQDTSAAMSLMTSDQLSSSEETVKLCEFDSGSRK